MADSVCIPQKADECPKDQYLNRHVVPEVAAACAYQPDVWRTLGIELLGEDGVTQLDVIKANNSDVTKCSSVMLTLWRQQKIDASWNQLIEALKRLKLNRFAAEIEKGLESPMEQDKKSDPAQVMKVIPTQRQDCQAKDSLQEESKKNKLKDTDSCKALVKFSKNGSINAAYTKMTSNIAVILETKNVKFNNLRRACFQEINALGSTLPKSLEGKIEPTKSLNELLDVLAQSPYWNWLDTRLLQALVSASGSPEAEKWLESFKEIFYAKKITEVIPYISIKPFKESTKIIEILGKDPKDVTISDLQKHKYKLEYEVLGIDEGDLVLNCIRIGSVEVTWQLPLELVYQAYTSMMRKHDELSSLAIKSLVCKEADQIADLPILLRGQEVGEVGTIEPLPEHVRREPYSLPQGFHWVTLSSSDGVEVVKFIKRKMSLFNFFAQHSNTRNEWQFSIKTTNGKLVAVVLAYRISYVVGGVSLTCVYPYIKTHPKYKGKRLLYLLIKELMRRVNLSNINHHILSLEGASVLQPVSTVHLWMYNFDHSTSNQLHSSPRTPGWRRMTSEDVPSALALVNQWSSQFEIRQVFNSEADFTYYFLSAPDNRFTYVVENQTNSITDLVTLRLDMSDHNALITAVVSTQSPVKQLIIDALVCVKESGAKVLVMCQYDIKPDILSSLSFKRIDDSCFSLYNYKYHEVSGSEFWQCAN